MIIVPYFHFTVCKKISVKHAKLLKNFFSSKITLQAKAENDSTETLWGIATGRQNLAFQTPHTHSNYNARFNSAAIA